MLAFITLFSIVFSSVSLAVDCDPRLSPFEKIIQLNGSRQNAERREAARPWCGQLQAASQRIKELLLERKLQFFESHGAQRFFQTLELPENAQFLIVRNEVKGNPSYFFSQGNSLKGQIIYEFPATLENQNGKRVSTMISVDISIKTHYQPSFLEENYIPSKKDSFGDSIEETTLSVYEISPASISDVTISFRKEGKKSSSYLASYSALENEGLDMYKHYIDKVRKRVEGDIFEVEVAF